MKEFSTNWRVEDSLLVTFLSREGAGRGALLGVGVVVVITMGGNATAKPFAKFCEERSS
jgi:hypothetical protein